MTTCVYDSMEQGGPVHCVSMYFTVWTIMDNERNCSLFTIIDD